MSTFNPHSISQPPLPKLSKATAWKWPRFIPFNDNASDKSSVARAQSATGHDVGPAKPERPQDSIVKSPSMQEALSSRSSLLSENQPISTAVAALIAKDGTDTQQSQSLSQDVNMAENDGSEALTKTRQSGIIEAEQKGAGARVPAKNDQALDTECAELGSDAGQVSHSASQTTEVLPPDRNTPQDATLTEIHKDAAGVHDPAALCKPDSLQAQTGIPLISVQKPSRETSEAGPINEESAKIDAGRVKASTLPIGLRSSTAIRSSEAESQGGLATISPQPAHDDPEATESPLATKPKRTFLPKIRNILVRRTYLKITLGRRLADPVKDVLRHQATGIDTTITEITVVG